MHWLPGFYSRACHTGRAQSSPTDAWLYLHSCTYFSIHVSSDKVQCLCSYKHMPKLQHVQDARVQYMCPGLVIRALCPGCVSYCLSFVKSDGCTRFSSALTPEYSSVCTDLGVEQMISQLKCYFKCKFVYWLWEQA